MKDGYAERKKDVPPQSVGTRKERNSVPPLPSLSSVGYVSSSRRGIAFLIGECSGLVGAIGTEPGDKVRDRMKGQTV